MADPYIDNVVLLLHCDGTNGGTTFTDNSRYAQTVTAGTGVTTSTTQAKFGTASATFTNTAGGLTSSGYHYALGTGDFTLEAWIYAPTTTWDDLGPYAPIFKIGTTNTAGLIQFGLNPDSGNPYPVAYGYTTTAIDLAVPGTITTISTNTWVHVALTRASGVFKSWVNGVQYATSTQTYDAPLTTVTIGQDNGNAFAGYIDDVRITKGVARYTATFTPPTAAFDNAATPPEPDFYWVTSLLHMDGTNGGNTFTDSSSLANTVTQVGTPTNSNTPAKFGSAVASFDGSTDALSLTGSALILGTNDFTVEMFFYVPAASGDIVDQYPTLFCVGGYNEVGGIYIPFDTTNDSVGATYLSSPGTGQTLGVATTGISRSAWHHFALTRSGNNFNIWIDGVSAGATTPGVAIDVSLSSYRIGYDNSVSADGFFRGYIDEFRVTKGVARYTSTFTPTTSAFPDATPAGTTVYGDATDSTSVSSTFTLSLGAPLTEVNSFSESTAALHIRAAIVLESLPFTEAVAAAAKLYQVTAFGIQAGEDLAVTRPVSLAETTDFTETLALIQGLSVAESLGLSDTLLPAGKFAVATNDTIRWLDSLRNFFGEDFSDSVNLTTVVSPVYRAIGTLSEALALSESLGGHFIFKVTAQDGVNIDDIDILSMVFKPVVQEGLELTAAYISPNGSISTWVVNTETSAITEYSNYGFNSFAQMGYKYLGANRTGLYELNGDTDAGTDIISVIKTGLSQIGGSRFTMFQAAYLGVRGGGDYVLRLETGDGRYYDYNVIAQDMQTTKIRLGKGLRARYFSFQLTSTGQDFDMDSVEFVPIVARRRV
jgi:hypothetical protein